MLFKVIFVVLMGSMLLMTGCNSQQVLTEQEKRIQAQAESAVAEMLFEANMDTQASYNVRKNGHVEIKFTPQVSLLDYTLMVKKLRQDSRITSVYATQSGSEVCPLK